MRAIQFRLALLKPGRRGFPAVLSLPEARSLGG
jgi:hypothetical protein